MDFHCGRTLWSPIQSTVDLTSIKRQPFDLLDGADKDKKIPIYLLISGGSCIANVSFIRLLHYREFMLDQKFGTLLACHDYTSQEKLATVL